MIKVVSRRTINPKHFDEVLEIYREMVEGSRQEPGNISYELFQDIDDPYTLVMIEEWESSDNQDYHESTPHYKRFKDKLQINTQRSRDIRFLKKLI